MELTRLRHVITTVNHRAEDLDSGDIVKLRIHNKIQWVRLVTDAERIDDGVLVQLAYRPIVGDREVLMVGRYDLIPVQIEKGT